MKQKNRVNRNLSTANRKIEVKTKLNRDASITVLNPGDTNEDAFRLTSAQRVVENRVKSKALIEYINSNDKAEGNISHDMPTLIKIESGISQRSNLIADFEGTSSEEIK